MSHSHDSKLYSSFDFLPVCRWLDTCEQLLIPRGCETCEFTRERHRNHTRASGAQVKIAEHTGRAGMGREVLAQKPPWKSAEAFLAELARRPSSASNPGPHPNAKQPPVKLPADLLNGLERGWEMGPVDGDSRWAGPAWPPTNDRLDLERWLGRQPGFHNWVLRTGRTSCVIGAELHVDEAREALVLLNESDRRWKTTLRFWSPNSWTFLFLHPAGRILNRNPFPGIRLYSSGNLIFVPPSVLSGKRLVYMNPNARLAEFPDIEAVLRRSANPEDACAGFED